MIDRIEIEATCSGADGSATGEAFSPHVQGKIQAVNIAYEGDKPATTDVTLEDENDPAGESIVTLPNNATDAKLYPRRAVQDNAGSDVTFDATNEIYAPYVVHGRLKLSVAQANNEDSVTATVWLEH